MHERGMATPPKNAPAKAPGKPTRPGHLPHGRWLGDFGRLSDAEDWLIECCAKGDAWGPEDWDEKRPKTSTQANVIRAELIRFLLLGGDCNHPVHETGVIAYGAWIKGTLDLHQCLAPKRLVLELCNFENAPILAGAVLQDMFLRGCHFPGLLADGLKVAGTVCLNDGCVATGEVQLSQARIGKDLIFSNSRLTNTSCYSLRADGVKVAGEVRLDDGFMSSGEVLLAGAEIDGDLLCANGTFNNSSGYAFSAHNLRVAGSVDMCNGFAAHGEVQLLKAEIGGNFNCKNGSFTNEGGRALSVDGIRVGHEFSLSDGFAASGEVTLKWSKIGVNLALEHGKFSNSNGAAITANGITVAGGLYLKGAIVEGAINLVAAKINLLIDDKECWQAGGHYLNGFQYERILGLTDAANRIAWLKGQNIVHLNNIGWAPQPWEQLIKVLREMGHPAEAAAVAIEKQRMMRAANRIGVRQPSERFGKLFSKNYSPAEIARLETEKMRLMRAVNRARAKPTAKWWIRILLIRRRTKKLKSNDLIYEKWTLLHYVQIALELIWLWLVNASVRLWHRIYELLAGFGHRPGRILFWMFTIWLSSAFWFNYAANTGLIAPTNSDIIMHRQLHRDLGKADRHSWVCGVRHEVKADQYWPDCADLPSEYTTFNPWLYSADLILPLVDLQQDSEWAPAATFTDATGTVQDLTEGQRARALMWFEILFGWFASLMFVAIVSRLVEKD
jgi:hypothetical protein